MQAIVFLFTNKHILHTDIEKMQFMFFDVLNNITALFQMTEGCT